MINTAVLKSGKFWVAILAAVAGVLISQHVVLEGSTISDVIGWALTLLGAGGAGHQVAAPAELPPA